MKLGIIGVRGVPNAYGGFEQFAEFLSEALVKRGHEVVVYSPHHHPYQESTWRGVQIIHKYDPQNLGPFSQFVYDFNCIKDSRSRGFDVILQLGYTSSSVWHWLLPKGVNVVTNMDGLEWKRSKYSPIVQRFLHFAESLAAQNSTHLVADSVGIQRYLKAKYKLDSTFIAYGADLVKKPEESMLEQYGLKPFEYDLVIARIEPENNIETIVKGYLKSSRKRKLVIVGNQNQNAFGKHLVSNYRDENLLFVGSVYDKHALDVLRWFSNVYFHGHSVGGTNPSLLEAMAANALICAHDNEFNRSVCGDSAFYFQSENDVAEQLETIVKTTEEARLNAQRTIIAERYSWQKIFDQYEDLLARFSK